MGGLWQSAQIMENLFVVVRKSMQIAPISCHDLTFVFVWSKYMQGWNHAELEKKKQQQQKQTKKYISFKAQFFFKSSRCLSISPKVRPVGEAEL